MLRLLAQARIWWSKQNAALLPIIFSETAPLDLRIVGRMLFHTALVGVAVGFAGAAFFGALEHLQRFLLEDLAGYTALRAHGEVITARPVSRDFDPGSWCFCPRSEASLAAS